jgi:histidyl-tRNA synthetase
LVFIARAGKDLEKQGFLLLSELRANRIASSCDFRAKSLKAQLRYGQKIGAELVVILGEDELKENKVILKDMSKSEQETLKLKDLTTKIKEKLKNYD